MYRTRPDHARAAFNEKILDECQRMQE